MGNIYSVHLLFNSQHGEEQAARIDFGDVLQLVGVVFLDGFRSTDFEGYLVDYDWDFGDGTQGTGETLAHTYEDNGVYTVTLTVTDDEGGTSSDTITVYVENIDNNDQVNAILGNNASHGWLNESGQYVVILECPADLVIINNQNQKTGLVAGSLVNEIEGAFVAKLYSDIEVYYIPIEAMYAFKVVGTGTGVYNLSIIGVENNVLKKYGLYDVICSLDSLDVYSFDFIEDTISMKTENPETRYSLELLTVTEHELDRFYLMDMRIDTNAIHKYEINDWETLSSGKPVTFFLDKDSDGVYEGKVDLRSGLTGEEVDRMLLRQPIPEPAFPFFLFFIAGVFFTIGVGTLLTEVGKWALLSLIIPLYSRIKKKDLLNQPIRYKIHGYVIGNPGAHFGLIKQDLKLGNGQVVYHLKRLMEADLIYSKEDGIRKRFYPKEFPESETNGHHFNHIEEKILKLVKETRGITQKKIAHSIGISRQVAGYHLSKMEEIGAIKKKLEGRHTKYYPLKDMGS
jgi:predicted transcriptional regulator